MTDLSVRSPADVDDLEALVGTLAARAADHDRDGSFPHEAFDALHAAGLLALTVPAEMGGSGAGLATACRAVSAVGRGDASVALVLSQHLMFHGVLARPNPWPRAVRERVQRSAVEGIALVNALRVEPDLGTPARGGLPATVAERLPAGAGWRITGRKIYSTGIPRLRWLVVYARTDDAEPLVGNFVVEAPDPAVRVVETWDHLGMRATASHDTVLDGVVVPADHAVDVRPAAEQGPPEPVLMAWNNLLISAVYLGVAQAARDWLTRYLHARVPTSLCAPLATLPRFQSAVGEMEALLHAGERLVHGTAAEVDDGPDRAGAATRSALAKHTATTNAIGAVERALALVGNPGLSRHHPLERHYRDVLCGRIHTPQDDTILLGAGRAALAAAAPGGPEAAREGR